MPATKDDIQRLRGVLAWAQRRGASKQEARVADALAEALAFLEKPDQRMTVILHLLSMLLGSMREHPEANDFWIVVDRFTQSFALKGLKELVPPAHGEHVELIGGSGPQPQ